MDGSPLDRYVAHCAPLELAAPWSELPTDQYAHLGPADPAAALGELRRDHSDEQLIDAGLAVREVTGSVAIHPYLSPPNVPFVALYAPKDRQVINLMTSAGCIVPPYVPLLATLHDIPTFKALARHDRIMYATGDLMDAVLLRGLGLAAAPIVGLDTLDGHGIVLFDLIYEVDARDPSEPVPKQVREARSCYRIPGEKKKIGTGLGLTIVAASIHARTLSAPPSVTGALEHLQGGATVLGGGPLNCNLWHPSQETLEIAARALTWAIPTRAVNLLLYSLESECESTLRAARLPEPPADLAATAARLHGCMADWASDLQAKTRLEAALAAFAAQVDREILAPLLQNLSTVSDPVLRARQFSLVQLLTLFAAEAQRFQYRSHLSRNGNEDHTPTKGDLRELLAAAKQIDNMAKEIESCRPQRRRRRTQ